MSSSTGDDPPVLHGVWVGPAAGPPEETPHKGTFPWVQRVAAGALLIVCGTAVGLLAGSPLAGAAGGAGLAAVVAVSLALARHHQGDRDQPAASAPFVVIDAPAPPDEPDDPHLQDLERALGALCRGDVTLFNRLVGRERSRYPDLTYWQHVELAIDHFRRDHH